MVQIKKQQSCIEGVVTLYYLLIIADGVISPKEIEMGKVMRISENIDERFFNQLLEGCKEKDNDIILKECIESLKNCEYHAKIRTIAWMSNIANSDGFMDPKEWSLIYRIYHKELNLDLSKIMEVQKTLPKFIPVK